MFSVVHARTLAIGSLLLIATGCGGVSELTRERVVRSATAVRQAEQAISRSEEGAVELQAARDHLDRAQRALQREESKTADRQAQKAELVAELAVARFQTASAQRAADELAKSIATLREETRRGAVKESGVEQ
jgi:hypothetical protein